MQHRDTPLPTGLRPSRSVSSLPESSALPAVRPVLLPRPNWLPQPVWPFETYALDIGGCSIAVTDVGRGPALLFVHTGLWSFIWRDVIVRLAGEFRCVCFDAPGTGQSERLPASDITLEKASRVMVGIVEALDLRDVTLVCHDLGGPSGIAGAANIPDRISAICAVNTFAWPPSGALLRGMLALMGNIAVREFDVMTELVPRITATTFGIGRHLDDASRRAFRSGIGAQAIHSFHAYMRDVRRSATTADAEKALSGTFRQLPVLTVFGERNDPFGFQSRWRQLFPDCRQVVVSRGNHFPMCDAPDLLATSIREFHSNRVAPARPRAD